MKKFSNWLAKPITWGGYLKLCGVAMVFSIITSIATYFYIYYDGFKDWVDSIVEKFQRKSNEEEP